MMKHGQFYKADQLVAAVHKAAGGIFAGFRAAHAYGRLYAGTFTATPLAKTLSRAAHFRGTPVPVTARLSGSSSDPAKAPVNVAAMATKFYLPDGTVTDLIGITLPAFFARTPDEFLDIVEALAPDPSTGQRDLARIQAVLAQSSQWRESVLDGEGPTGLGEFCPDELQAAPYLLLRQCGRRRALGTLPLGAGGRDSGAAARRASEAAARPSVRRVRNAFARRSGRISARARTRPRMGSNR